MFFGELGAIVVAAEVATLYMLHRLEVTRFQDDSLLFCQASSLEWSRLLKLLELYEQASGQRLNKDKTSIFFSNNTRTATKDLIASIAGIRSTGSYEKYLGLPALVGRSRDKVFKGILDRVRSKLTNWKMKFLSKAGKENLIKSVIRAIPTYSMGVFKLPKGLQEINKLMRGYWWGQIGQERRMHWIKWDQMGKAKAIGGLGFRDFENFNLAMLAKQGWSILQFPDSLAAKILN